MFHLRTRGRFGRIVPMWLRCFLLGLAISWLVAIGCWLRVEIGLSPRFTTNLVPDEDLSGQQMIEYIDQWYLSQRGRASTEYRYNTVSYGWPTENWGCIYRSNGAFVEPVIGLDIRRISQGGILPHPYKKRFGASDPYDRCVPLFPLLARSLFAGIFYGLPLYFFLLVREFRRRRWHCRACGYDCSTVPGTICPECGSLLPASMVRSAKAQETGLT
jgi:hypothetical protein